MALSDTADNSEAHSLQEALRQSSEFSQRDCILRSKLGLTWNLEVKPHEPMMVLLCTFLCDTVIQSEMSTATLTFDSPLVGTAGWLGAGCC
eukprot:3729846-Amphidinium_carterae.1